MGGPHSLQRQPQAPRRWGHKKELLKPRMARSPIAERGEEEEACFGQQVGGLQSATAGVVAADATFSFLL